MKSGGESTGRSAQLRKVKELKEEDLGAAGIHSHILQIVVTDLDKAFFRRGKGPDIPGSRAGTVSIRSGSKNMGMVSK